ncbi:MAG: hypothetical protein JWL62_3150 [Hyphomicrobiales bacterium]|nr:hypothetical protein [Hyphomicrobiales bacterium]
MQAQGEGIVIASGNYTQSALSYDSRGLLRSVTGYRKFELSTLVEYGYTADTTLIVMPTLRDVRTTGSEPVRARGLGLLDVGARTRLATYGDIVFSAQVLVRLPVQPDSRLVGENQTQAEVRLGSAMPYSLFGFTGFVDTSAAYVRRSGVFADEAHVDLTIGTQYSPRLLALWQVFGTWSMGGRIAGTTPRGAKMQSSMVYSLTPEWSLQLGAYSTITGVSARREEGFVTALAAPLTLRHAG